MINEFWNLVLETWQQGIRGIGIDNIIVELNGPEVPIMDGSSLPFIEIIEGCTIKSLKAKRKILKIFWEILFLSIMRFSIILNLNADNRN